MTEGIVKRHMYVVMWEDRNGFGILPGRKTGKPLLINEPPTAEFIQALRGSQAPLGMVRPP